MKVLRPDSPNWKASLANQILPATNIVVMHLGRGGVMEDGTLDPYNTGRVLQTLEVASDIEDLQPSARVQILWTGGCNRKQDRSGTRRPASEGRAAIQCARPLVGKDDNFTMLTEENSTSTVENATRSSELVANSDVIVVVTDPLHYVARKIQFIMWLVFPYHRVVFVELPTNPPGTSWKNVAVHLVSTFITVAGMAGVTRGDSVGVQQRQNRLQRLTGH